MKLKKIKKLIVFAAHPDDETIGCGGTIKKLSQNGCEVIVVFATTGNTGIDQSRSYEKNIKNIRLKEANSAAKILGIKKIISWKNSSQELQYNIKSLHETIELIRKEKPDLVISHSNIDKHNDHIVLNKIITQACLKAGENLLPSLGFTYRVKNVWAFEVVDILSNVDYVVDISDQLKFKIDAINKYKSQHKIVKGIKNFIEGISLVRGYQIGTKNAEAFMDISSQPQEVL